MIAVRRRGRGALALVVLAAVTAAAAEPARDLPPPSRVRDLHYGDLLFHFFQDDYFGAVVRLEAARDMGRFRNHAADAELLAGGLYLSLGLHAEAARIFERLLVGPVPRSVSDRAHFYLARIGYQRGYYAEAERSLQRIRGVLPAGLEPERRLLAANVMMAQGRYADAAGALAAWQDDSSWANFARFNLGVALVRSGDVAAGRRWLEAVGTLLAGDEEQRALRDRANLALGYALLQQHEPEPAAVALSRVRLDGPFTNRALLALGWAEADAARPERALVPWLELRAGRVLDASVQESYLAVPYAYAQLAANGQAAEQYRGAVTAYAAEAVRIDESIAAIRSGGFLDALLGASPQDGDLGWRWQLERAPDAPHTRYLYHLLATHEFQEGLRNYRDLRIMQRNLERWQESLGAFDEMIAAREAVNAERVPRREQVLGTLDLAALEGRYADLDRRAADIAARRDVGALADPRQADQWRALAAALERIESLPAGPERDALAERARLLRGKLLWQMDADYKLRAWRLQSELGATRAALDEMRHRAGQVALAGAIAPRDTLGFAARVQGLERRIGHLRPRLAAAALAQERVLASVAVRELEAQKARLRHYGIQAQFALAALYDGAAAGGAP